MVGGKIIISAIMEVSKTKQRLCYIIQLVNSFRYPKEAGSKCHRKICAATVIATLFHNSHVVKSAWVSINR